MEFTRTAVGIIAAASITVGAAGTYLATRGDEPTLPAPVAFAEPEPELAPAPPPAEPPAPAPVPPVQAAPRPVQAAPPPVPAVAASRPAPQVVEPRVESPTPVLPEPEVPFEPVPPAVAREEAEPSRWVPPAPVYEELIVPANAVIGLQVENTLSSETAEVEDRVTARVTREVRSGSRVAIPVGTRLEGEVVDVERGGRVRERARLGVRFTTAVLPDGTRLPLVTETVYREGDPPSAESAAKIGGGAIGGAIIGGILGGARGAAIGGSAGAGAGTAAVLAGGRNPATIQAGTPLTVRIERPVTVIVER